MKLLKTLVLPFICLTAILITFVNLDKIANKLLPIITQDKQVLIKAPNIYQKKEEFLFVQNTTDFIPLSKKDLKNIFYTIINNGWQEFTFYCPKEYTNCLSDVRALGQDQELLTHLNNYVHPYNGFSNIQTLISEDGSVTVILTYFYNQDHIEAINNEVDKIIKENITPNMTDLEKIKTIHDYIINHTKYDITRNNDGESTYQSYLAYGALLEGYATCNGYTDAMAIFLNKFNIPNFKIAMTPEDLTKEGHVWNAVYLNNQWLHLDLTWDDPVSTDGTDYLEDNYFLITTEQLKENDENGETKITEHLFKPNFYLEFKKTN